MDLYPPPVRTPHCESNIEGVQSARLRLVDVHLFGTPSHWRLTGFPAVNLKTLLFNFKYAYILGFFLLYWKAPDALFCFLVK